METTFEIILITFQTFFIDQYETVNYEFYIMLLVLVFGLILVFKKKGGTR